MNAKVHDLMSESVVTVQPHTTVGHIRTILKKNRFTAVPVVDTEGRPIGIVSQSDLVADLKTNAPAKSVMTDKVYTVPRYEDARVAARIMRKHKIHRIVVTHERKVVGMISAFDLLSLVEQHRWVPKNPPTESSKKSGRI